MTPAEAEDLAARTLAAIDTEPTRPELPALGLRVADRERVASDLAVTRHWHQDTARDVYLSAAAYGLRRTAALYGVTS